MLLFHSLFHRWTTERFFLGIDTGRWVMIPRGGVTARSLLARRVLLAAGRHLPADSRSVAHGRVYGR